MDLVRNIFSHFIKNKSNKQPSLTVNGVTIQQIKNLQQNDDTEPNNEDFIEIDAPPHKRLKKNDNRTKNSNISKPIILPNDNLTVVPIENNDITMIIDLTDNLEELNVLQINETAENSNSSEARVPSDDKQTIVPINNDLKKMIIDLTDNLEIQNELEMGDTTENSNVCEASDAKKATISVNNYTNELKNKIKEDVLPLGSKETPVSVNNNTNETIIIDDNGNNLNTDNLHGSQTIPIICDTKDNTTISKDIIPSGDQKTVVSADNNIYNTTIEDTSNPNSNNVQNISKIGETTENSNITVDITASDDKPTEISTNKANNTTFDNTDNPYCNKLHKSEIIPNISIENFNNEVALNNDETEETTTTCIKEFEDILANIESDLTLDLEISPDEVNDLMNDLIFSPNDEVIISDTESDIPIHIVRKDGKTHIPTSNIDFSYDLTVETVDSNKPVGFPIEINNSNTERDATMNTTSNTGNTKVTGVSNGNKAITTNETKNYDAISLSSDENTNIEDYIFISDDSSDSDCGYHSSDFEIITEEEAKRDGLIINFRPDKLKPKDLNAKPESRQPKRKKMTSNSKNIKTGPTRTLKVPTNTKNVRGIQSKPLRKTSSDRPRLSQNLTAHTNDINVQTPSNFQARPRNSVQNLPLNVQAGPSKPVQMPSNVEAGPKNPVQKPSNVQAKHNNLVQRPPNVQAGPSNVQRPTNVQEGPSNAVQRPSNVQAGPSNTVQMPSNVQTGPSNPVKMPSNVQAGPSNTVPMSSIVEAGPSNPVQRPSNVQQNVVNNYESYRNKYRQPFKNDTSYRNNHNEPQGDNFLDLFRGFHAGVPRNIRENKSTKSYCANPNMWYRGVGFDIQMMRGNSSDEEDDQFKDEANDTAKKIKSKFP